MQKRILIFAGIVVLLVAAGRADDAFKPDDEGFIRNWLVLAPLPFGGAKDGAEALGKQQVPDEAKLQPKTKRFAKSRRKLSISFGDIWHFAIHEDRSVE